MSCHEDSETIEGVRVGGGSGQFFFSEGGTSRSFIGCRGFWCVSVDFFFFVDWLGSA